MKTFYLTEINEGKIFTSLSECKRYISNISFDDKKHYSNSYIIKLSGNNIQDAKVLGLYLVFHHNTNLKSEMKFTRQIKINDINELKMYKSRWSSPYQLIKYMQMNENERPFFISSIKLN